MPDQGFRGQERKIKQNISNSIFDNNFFFQILVEGTGRTGATTLSISTLSITTLSIMTLDYIMPNAVMLSVVMLSVENKPITLSLRHICA